MIQFAAFSEHQTLIHGEPTTNLTLARSKAFHGVNSTFSILFSPFSERPEGPLVPFDSVLERAPRKDLPSLIDLEIPFDLSSCRHVFLDVGSGQGDMLRRMYDGLYEERKMPKSSTPLEAIFSFYFGRVEQRRNDVCTLCWEPIRSVALAEIVSNLNRSGVRVHWFATAAWVDSDKVLDFHVRQGRSIGRKWKWRGTLDNFSGATETLQVKPFDLVRLVQGLSSWRSLSHGAVVLTLDAQGTFPTILTELILTSAICNIEHVLVDVSLREESGVSITRHIGRLTWELHKQRCRCKTLINSLVPSSRFGVKPDFGSFLTNRVKSMEETSCQIHEPPRIIMDDVLLAHPRPSSFVANQVFPELRIPFDLSACSKVYLDLGSNEGHQIRKLFDNYLPSSPWGSLFSFHFGDVASRRRDVCAVAFEPDPSHAKTQSRLQLRLVSLGVRFHTLTSPVWVTNEVMNFTSVALDKTDVKRVGSSLDEKVAIGGLGVARYQRRAFDIVQLFASLAPHARVLVKMDIEGAEHLVLQHLVSSHMLCRADFIGLEVHRSMQKYHSPLSNPLFLSWVLARSPQTCKTLIVDFDDET